MHEAKTRLSALIKAVEETGEPVIICRAGKEVAEIRPRTTLGTTRRNLAPDPNLWVRLAPGYDPTEPADEREWPAECRQA
jgi:antitoxin (DNA-binding transcriptional repressor) of toxin-antitoxin stability system